ncbi:uncharacterized protein LOC127772090 [Oryza glaberrima]|uniref:uncharacterized protein LOC127772090 n=1 Tax=Oryza glaberrima TaxID=4538 RepID=UPI00224C3F95|nr:uncharacterized protein LOC127772090 [Oryza glaberrima]
MGRGSNAVVVLLLGVALLSLAAGPAAGDMRAVLAGGGGGGKVGHHHHGIDEAVRQLMVATRLEDVVAAELGMDDLHQRVLGGGGKNSKGLIRDQPTCVPTCSKPGEAYIGRGCGNVYGCQGGKASPSSNR